MARSLKNYYNIYLWINLLVYMLYVIIKSCAVVIYLILLCRKDSEETSREDNGTSKEESSKESKGENNEASKGENSEESKAENNEASKGENREESKGENNEASKREISEESTSDTNIIILLIDNAESKSPPKKTCCQRFQRMKWIEWSVKLVFRNQLELEDKLEKQERSTDQKSRPELHKTENGQSSDEDGPKIVLNHQSTVILFTLIATFGLLAIGSALNNTLLSVTHTCTEAPNINCYPQPINKVEVQNAGLNISTDKPIEDCSFWNSEGVSDKVSFICYQLTFNVEIFLAIIGGLSTVFVVTMRTVIRVLLWCTRKCGKINKKNAAVARYIFFGILSLIELVSAIFGMVLQGTGTNDNDTPGVMFLATHAAEILLVFGIIPTLLLLPWEKYATRTRESSN